MCPPTEVPLPPCPSVLVPLHRVRGAIRHPVIRPWCFGLVAITGSNKSNQARKFCRHFITLRHSGTYELSEDDQDSSILWLKNIQDLQIPWLNNLNYLVKEMNYSCEEEEPPG